jgi:hypothetical protein
MKTILPLRLLVTAVLLANGRAQSVGVDRPTADDGAARVATLANPVKPAEDNTEWETLAKAADAGRIAGLDGTTDAAALKQVLARHAEDLVAKADSVKDFVRRNPASAKVVEARRLEAVLLINAVQAGDVAVEARMNATVETLRTDPAVPEPVRAEVAGLTDFFDAARHYANATDRRVAFETVARGLIQEFPNQPQGYESLLTIAGESDEAKGLALARELSDLPAPPAVRAIARSIVARHDLVGQSLAQALGKVEVPEISGLLKDGGPVLLYTWATWSPGGLELARFLADRPGKGGGIVALNLDRDVAAAKSWAAANALRGTAIYDDAGPEGVLAQRLQATGAPLVYFVDAGGVIRDVRGTDDLERKLGQAGF